MKGLKIIFILAFTGLMLQACSKSNNPASPNTNNTLKGTWKLNYYGNNNDTLNVTLNINGSNNKIDGNGDFKYSEQLNGSKRSVSNSGTLAGNYTDSTLTVTLGDFNFAGIKSGSNYKGTAVLLAYVSPNPDTVIINNAVFVKH